jgi:7-keto-8-aminopelargonate synthetase-like enzyme
MLDAKEEVFPTRGAHLVVCEAHATGTWGPEGHRMVSLLGLEDRILAMFLLLGKQRGIRWCVHL